MPRRSLPLGLACTRGLRGGVQGVRSEGTPGSEGSGGSRGWSWGVTPGDPEIMVFWVFQGVGALNPVFGVWPGGVKTPYKTRLKQYITV